jgi:hypothetical protein
MELPPQFIYTDRAQGLSSDVTTVGLYHILLGRDPENSFVIEEAKSQPIAELMKSFLASTEFTSFVRTPIREGQRLRHDLMAPAPTPAQIAWVTSLIVLPPAQQRAISAAPSWREFFISLLPSLLGGYDFASKSQHHTIGRIEACTAVGIRGWALRLPVTDKPVEIECLIGAYSMGRTLCSESRAELTELFGCRCSTGFHIPFEEGTPVDRFRGLDVQLIDVETKSLIDGPRVFELSSTDEKPLADRLRENVNSLERKVSDLKIMIDDVAKMANR